ncbi:S8 family serine peptidase [Corynebacterium sp. H130]|uniref:S8 family serine peptidase n=1 Tax=Corynebacterium sp. H130 TaxID=3133444 RepID=UPI0030AC772F
MKLGTLKRAATALFALSLPLAATAVPSAVAQPVDNSIAIDANDTPVALAEKPAERIIVVFRDLEANDTDARDARMALINEVVDKHYPQADANFFRLMLDGSYVVKMSETVPVDPANEIITELSAHPDINFAAVSQMMRPILPPKPANPPAPEEEMMGTKAATNDIHYSKQWHLFAEYGANVEKAWDLGYLGGSQTVGIVDSGLTRHPDISEVPGKLAKEPNIHNGGLDFINGPNENDPDPGRDYDYLDTGDWHDRNFCFDGDPGGYSSWHGTHVAGLVAAAANNTEGVAGTAPEAKLLIGRALGTCGGATEDIADALKWLAGVSLPDTPANPNPAKVINMSLGGNYYTCDPVYGAAISAARSKGATILIAAGNDNVNTSGITPANCPGTIVVGATGPQGYRSNFSNWGTHVDIGAPGGNSAPFGFDPYTGMPNKGEYNTEDGIYSAVNLGETNPGAAGYGYMDGTSMATPIVSGIVAMMLDANPNLSADRIEAILKETARTYQDEPTDSYGNSYTKTASQMGAGLVDAYAAVCQALTDAGRGDECATGQAVPTTVTNTATATATATATVTTTVTPAPQTVTTTVEPSVIETTTTAAPETTTMIVDVPTTVVETTTIDAAPVTTTVTTVAPTTVTGPVASITSTVPTTVVKTTTVDAAPVTTTEVTNVTTTVPGVEVVVTETDSVPTTVTLPGHTEPATTTTETIAPTTQTEVVTSTEPAPTVTKEVPTTVVTTENGAPTTVVTTVPGVEVTTTEMTTTTTTVTETATDAPVPVVTTTVTAAPAPGDNGSSSSGLWFVPLIFGGVLGLIAHFFAPTMLGNQDNGSSTQMGYLGIFAGLAGILTRLFHLGNGAEGSTTRITSSDGSSN